MLYLFLYKRWMRLFYSALLLRWFFRQKGEQRVAWHAAKTRLTSHIHPPSMSLRFSGFLFMLHIPAGLYSVSGRHAEGIVKMKEQGAVVVKMIIFWVALILLVRQAILAGWIDRLIM